MTDLSDISISGLWRVLAQDLDPVETKEWLDAFDAIVENEGAERATFVLRKLLDHARMVRVPMPPVLNTPYANTVSLADQPQFPGNPEIEARISALVRWNALAMVVRANRANSELGGHIATYAETYRIGQAYANIGFSIKRAAAIAAGRFRSGAKRPASSETGRNARMPSRQAATW